MDYWKADSREQFDEGDVFEFSLWKWANGDCPGVLEEYILIKEF